MCVCACVSYLWDIHYSQIGRYLSDSIQPGMKTDRHYRLDIDYRQDRRRQRYRPYSSCLTE